MGLTEAPCATVEEFMQVVNYGLTERTTDTTFSNYFSRLTKGIIFFFNFILRKQYPFSHIKFFN